MPEWVRLRCKRVGVVLIFGYELWVRFGASHQANRVSEDLVFMPKMRLSRCVLNCTTCGTRDALAQLNPATSGRCPGRRVSPVLNTHLLVVQA